MSSFKRLLFAIFFLCFASQPWAAGWLPLAGGGTGGGYTGPGDVISGATAWWGLRGYSAAYSTGSNSAAVVCNATTFTTCSTINILSNGTFDTATASGSAACATACVVKSFTDQTGNGITASCAAAASCGTLTFSCIGSLPCITCTACVYTPTTGSLVQPFTIVTEWEYTSSVGNLGLFGTTSNGNLYLNIGSTSFTYDNGTPSSGVPSAVNTQNALSIVFNGAACASNLNGSSVTGVNCGTAGFGETTFTFGEDAFGNELIGQIEEMGIWSSTNAAFTPTQQTSMNTNMAAFW